MGRGGGHTHHSIGNPLRSEERKGGKMKQPAQEAPGRRARARGRGPGLGPTRRPGTQRPANGLPGAAIPPKLQLDGSARGPAIQATPAGSTSPRTRACQPGAAGRGPGWGRGRNRAAGGEAGAGGSHLGVVVEMVPAHVGRRANAAGSEAARGRETDGKGGLNRRTELLRGTNRRRQQPRARESGDS